MAVVGALAVGQTVIILTAGIDLSIGMAMVLSSLVMVKLNYDHGVPGPIALLIGIGVGLLTGLLNGVLVTRLNLPPFIVTLGTFSIFTAVSLLYAAGQTIALDPDALLVWTGKTISIGSVSITWGVILMLLLYAGRRVRAAQHGLGPTSLRHRRRPRGLAAGRHQHRPGAAQRLRRRRAPPSASPPGSSAAGSAARTRTPASTTTCRASPPSSSAAPASSAVAAW